MANTQIAGFQPLSHSGLPTLYVRKRVLTANTDRICKFDALDNTAAGDVIAHTTEDGEVYSVSMGASYVSGNDRLERPALPASTAYSGTTVDPANASYVYAVSDMVTTRFKASIDEAVALTDVGLNFNMVLTVGTGSYSTHEVDATNKGTTATNPWRLMDIITGDPKSDPDLADAACVFLVNSSAGEPALEIGGSLGI